MRIDNQTEYYKDKSAYLGWGVSVAQLNNERVQLLDRYVIGPRVLDVACGSGIYTDHLAAKGFDAWGIDLVGDFIEKAKETKKGNFIQGEADKLPFADKEFDTVLLFDILEHGDDTAILREAKRVASKRILVNLPRKIDTELEETGLVFRHYIDKSHIREYQEQDLFSMAGSLNLRIVECIPIHVLDPILVFRALFSGKSILLRFVRILIKLLLAKRSYPTAFFLVLDV